jgi:hypothetical protein
MLKGPLEHRTVAVRNPDPSSDVGAVVGAAEFIDLLKVRMQTVVDDATISTGRLVVL